MDVEPSPGDEDDEVQDLEASLAGLAGVLTTHGGLERTLTHVAEFAVRAIPGADGAGLTLLEDGRQQTVVATTDFVREIDDIQYALHEGPCVTAVAERRTVVTGNLGGERMWPRFGPRVGRLGVHSALSLPLLVPTGVVGALNVYAHGRDGFAPASVDLGEAFAPAAAVSAANARMLAQAERTVGQLQQALVSRADIDQALGIVMSRSGVDATEAFDRLRALSQTRSIKLSEVAREIIEEAVRRARARHTGHEAGPLP